MKSFASSSLASFVVDKLNEQGFNVPTDAQALIIPKLLSHDGDFVAKSPTGTGKTIAYAAPLLSSINQDRGVVQAVVLLPTRELSEQVGNVLSGLAGEYVKVEAIYGGVGVKNQTHRLSNGTQVVVATPGRLLDLVQRKVVDLKQLEVVVFDEADEMLLKGFTSDIDKILGSTDRDFKSWFFSASMPSDLNKMLKGKGQNILRVALGEDTTNASVRHLFTKVTPEEKLNVLLHHLTRFGDEKGVIFCRTKSGVQKLYKQLSANKISSGALHGDLPQGLRNKMMDQFREGQIQYLIATDVAARGVDIQDCAFVIQYHVPDTAEIYGHRAGRTSRLSTAGTSLTFYFSEEQEKYEALKISLNTKILDEPVPNPKDLLVNKAFVWASKIAKSKPVGENLDELSKENFKDRLRHLSKDELLEKLLATYLREIQA